jgi:lipopolysaccharide transport system ATP-binding protein
MTAEIELKDIYVMGVDYLSRANTLKERFLSKKNSKLIPTTIPILNGVDFEAKSGDRIGILGCNGSGKTSLLKVIIGTYPPQSGSIRIEGRMVPLVGLGAEFMPTLTGRDNIKLSFAYRNNLAQYSKELENKIIEFSELGEYIDKPMINYSSGMGARFGFSCGIFQDTDILLLDEVFATGDAGFIKKAEKFMQKKWDEVEIGISVSHSTEQIKALCTKCYVMDQGKIVDFGTTSKMIKVYEEKILKL